MPSKRAARPADPARSSTSDRRRPPSVETVLGLLRPSVDRADVAAVTAVVRDAIEGERARLRDGAPPRDPSAIAELARERLEGFAVIGVPRVINATGVLIHTNLGRAPWAPSVARVSTALAAHYALLELDRATGRRGQRARIGEDHLVALTGAEDAFVTNNNAAAVALAVGLVGRGGIAVSRGELVEIGGGVRIPEIVRRAGAKLIEVGTTNRTRASDFEGPLADGKARAVLRVHPSNFAMQGFIESPDATAVAALAHRHGAIVIDDLGSGALLDTAAFGLAHEPMPNERLADGADVVTFSGDKLVGGPQAGLVVGRAELIAKMRRDPLARAMRPDKTTMAALALTLGLYRSGQAVQEIPVWRMLATPLGELEARAQALTDELGEVASAVPLQSAIGGGSLPGETIPSAGIALTHRRSTALLAALRNGEPPLIGRIAEGRVLLDLRTVDASEDATVVTAIRGALARLG
jgi:L-seryl-tRNA(Ser) seleniumtransferase